MTIQLPPNSTGTLIDVATLGGKDRELVVLAGDGAVAEVAGVVLTQPAETEYGLITRGFERVDGETLSTANLGISGVFTGAWNDANADGVAFVEAAAFADEVSAASGFVIEGSDDTADSNFTRTLDSFTVIASTLATIQAAIPTRYWRVKYTNGGTAQASFRLTAAARNRVVPAVDSAGQAQVDVLTLPANASVDVAQIAGTATSVNTGTRDAGTQRVTVATDDLVPISAASLPLPAGAATSANQLADGHNVTVDNAVATPVPVRQSDGAAFYTGAKTGQLPTALVGGRLDVVIGAPLPAGTNNIGDVDVLTLPANASVNLNQVGGTAVVTGGVAGSQGVGGLAATGAAVAGNPVLVAGSDGTNAQNILVTPNGRQIFTAAAVAADGDSNTLSSPFTSSTLSFKAAVASFVFNGSTWDRLRGDTNGLNVSDISAGTQTNPIEVVGDVAAGVAAAGNPVLIAARANANEPTAVADAQSTYLWADLQGRLVTTSNFPSVVAVDSTHGPKRVALTGTGDVALVPAPGASLSVYVTGIGGSNSSATKTDVHLKDGTTIRWEWTVAADGGGFFTPFDPPWKLTANTILNGALSAAVTDVNVNVHYFVAP